MKKTSWRKLPKSSRQQDILYKKLIISCIIILSLMLSPVVYIFYSMYTDYDKVIWTTGILISKNYNHSNIRVLEDGTAYTIDIPFKFLENVEKGDIIYLEQDYNIKTQEKSERHLNYKMYDMK